MDPRKVSGNWMDPKCTLVSRTCCESALFPRIEEVVEEAPKKEEKPKVEEKNYVTIDKFFETELKVGTVLEAEEAPKSNKLLILKVDLGNGDIRQIVAGIAQFYTPESIVGKTIVVVSNLKPAKICGLESNGMLLAAKIDGQLKIVTVDGDISSGASVG